MIKREKGFTLVELLIVVVIIGILAGVLVTIINPEKQSNRARDAGIQASITKIALATEGFISAYGDSPTDVQFAASLNNITGQDCAGGDYSCNFAVNGNPLDSTCAGDGFTNDGTGGQCYFHYDGDPEGDGNDGEPADVENTFTISAASYGLVNTNFVYDNTTGVISEETN